MSNIFSNDPEFHKFHAEQDKKDHESMDEDGYRVEQWDDYEDGYYERQDSLSRR